jgi:cytochrome c oxidase accessory protein FixG
MTKGNNAATKENTASTKEVVISLYKAQEKIYPRSIFGYFAKWRWVMIWLTQLFFYGVPWLEWGQRQALLFDLPAKRFYIFNLVLYPQDLIYLTAILIISALSLFLFTAIAGRLWCGYTCPQTVYTEIFLWIERKIEGDRAKRMKLDASSMSFQKLARKFTKHLIWIAFAAWTGFTFVGYFTPIRELSADLLQLNLGSWATFWVIFYGFATYGNAGFMREQVCKYMCPYARFQSAMFDDDTLIVTYDEERGEPRGAGSRKKNAAKTESLGSCIDCSLCVQVCPTGIDIREGLQYECIGCGLCADVCDDVMDKVGEPRGLIKYTTQNAMDNHWTRNEMLKRILRPRVLIYSTILGLLIVGLLASIWFRTPFKVDIVRDRSVLARLVEGGMLENVYRLQIMNATEVVHQYKLNVSGLENAIVGFKGSEKNPLIQVESAEARWIVVDIKIPDGSLESGKHKIQFQIEEIDSQKILTEKSIFLVPR